MSYEEKQDAYRNQPSGGKCGKESRVMYVLAGAAIVIVIELVILLAGKFMGGSSGIADTEDVDSETEIVTETETVTETEITNDEKVGEILHADKNEMAEMDSYSWITYMNSALEDVMNEDLSWVIMLFDDGTGLFIPEGNIELGVIYGDITDEGSVTKEYGEIAVIGKNVIYTEYEGDAIRDADVMELIGYEYYNDDTFTFVDELYDGEICITINITTSEDTDEANLETAELLIERVSPLDPYSINVTVNGDYFAWTKGEGIKSLEELMAEADEMEAEAEEEYEASTDDVISEEEWEAVLKEYGLWDSEMEAIWED